ncbi:hypothetical protein [Phenylobacterium sp. LjRoot225]|uniref:hypothetical protein n=1 Tax=Phenylobacterium sp. LjRoot225 TaxID=3342285 RepID=UPI003F4FE7B0
MRDLPSTSYSPEAAASGRSRAGLATGAPLVAVCMALTGCATTKGAPGWNEPDAAKISYFAPKTELEVQGDLRLLACDADRILAAPTLSLVQRGAADPAAEFHLEGRELLSSLQKRELALDLTDDRTIRSLNAASSDRTGAVITNILKIFTTVASTFSAVTPGPGPASAGARPALRPAPPPPSLCNAQTMEALRQANDLAATIQKRRAALSTASPADAEKVGAQIDVLVAQLAFLSTGPLTISLWRPLEVGDAPVSGASVNWTIKDLAKWMSEDPQKEPCTPAMPSAFTGTGCKAQTAHFALGYSVAGTVDEKRPSKSRCLHPIAGDAPMCARTLVLAEPTPATVTLTANNGNFVGRKEGDTLGLAEVPMAQWGPATYLPLDVGFSQSRSVGMTFDQFGRKSSFSWGSEATAENATGSLAEIAEAGAAARKAVRGKGEVEVWEEEAARLETRLKLNKLQACQAVIEAGGTVCPATD